MARNKIDFDTVRRIGLELPDVEESTMYGSPALKVHGKLLTCIPIHKSAEPNSLAVRVDFGQRAELLETDPDVYYLKDHYVNYPVVLVRLSRIHADALRDLLGIAWNFVSAQTGRGKRGARGTGSPRRKQRVRSAE
ncbi:MAG: MmcQ/YjbR family DNA-binding protein [Bryobacteraceae bacterium]